jgi:hypothetical protein
MRRLIRPRHPDLYEGRNRTAAINYYKNFEIVLRRNLDTPPNDELKLLYRELNGIHLLR